MRSLDYEQMFRRYVDAMNAALDDADTSGTIQSFYAETSLALSLDGRLQAATNAELGLILSQMQDLYRKSSMQAMTLGRVEATALEENHDRVVVHYIADYLARGATVPVPFSVTYLCQRRGEDAKIFAFIAGDEAALLRQYGVLDEQGGPTPG